MQKSLERLPLLAPGPESRAAGEYASLEPSRIKRNSTACLACKQAKRKVSSSYEQYYSFSSPLLHDDPKGCLF